MFAIFEDGSHQYRVQAGDTVRVDFRKTSARGDTLTFDRVLLFAGQTDAVIGHPLIEGARIEVQVTDPEFKGPKLEGGKFKRRKGYIRHWGHTQRYTEVLIQSISVPGQDPVLAPVPTAKPAAAESGDMPASESETQPS